MDNLIYNVHTSDMNISVAGSSPIPDLEPIDRMRNLEISHDREKITLTFHDESYSLTRTMQAVKELHKKLEKPDQVYSEFRKLWGDAGMSKHQETYDCS